MTSPQMVINPSYWRKCSSCKKPIPFLQKFWVCNVSTCNRKRTGMVFCTVACWDSHVPIMNHRESWAEERRAPSKEIYLASKNADSSSESKKAAESGVNPHAENEKDILVVASKLKAWVRRFHGMNTAQSVLDALSDAVRKECDDAIKKAKAAGRSTVMDRDF